MNKKHTQLVPWLIVALMIIFIFSNSLVPGTGSKAVSSSFTSTLYDLLVRLQLHVDYEVLHHLIRKSAHFLEYAILGGLITWASTISPLPKSKYPLYPCFLIIPVIDETIQLFSPGRSSEIGDMLIDATGLIVGYMMIRLFIRYVVKKAERGSYEN